MNYLFIDGSENTTFAQAGKSNVFFNDTFDTRRNLGAKITEICDSMLQRTELTRDAIDIFAVCTGPGSLTGLRVANSFMRTLAYLNQKPFLGIDLFSWSAATLAAKGIGGRVCLIIPTLIDKAFVQIVDLDQNLLEFNPDPHLLENRVAHTEIPTYGIRWQAEHIERIEPTAEVLHKLILQKQNATCDFSQLLKVLPMYVIPSQAERKLEEKQC